MRLPSMVTRTVRAGLSVMKLTVSWSCSVRPGSSASVA